MHRKFDKTTTSSARSARRSSPVNQVRRQVKPRSLSTYSNELHGRPDEDEESGPVMVGHRASAPTVRDEGLGKLIEEINENYLGCIRVTKATVEFGRMAGQKLREIQRSIGDDAFDRLVAHSLPLSRHEAASLIRFSREPEVTGVDVSPATAMSLTGASRLAGLLHAHGGAAR